MPAFNFQHDFALAVQSGAKRQTIRPLLGTRRLDTQAEMDELARLDGFRDWFWMKGWFSMQYGLPFRGFLIQWGDA